MRRGVYGVAPLGAYYLVSSNCTAEKEFEFAHHKFTIVRGEEFIRENGLVFPVGFEKTDPTHKMMFGPVFYHPGVIHSRNNFNLRLASIRQLCVRKPSEKGLDQMLCENQRRYLHGGHFDHVITQLKRGISEELCSVNRDVTFKEYVEQPHPKRKLRMQARDELLDEGMTRPRLSVVEAKVKTEWGKVVGHEQKIPRVYVNLGVDSPLSAGHLIPLVKQGFKPVYVDQARAEFAKEPTKVEIMRLLNNIISGGPIEFIYFSDDSCVAIECVDGRFMANVDISSCDASHTEVPFDVIQEIASADALRDDISLAIDQCRSILRFNSYVKGSKHVVDLKPRYPALYSGSVLTTVINNVANLLIFKSIVDLLRGRKPLLDECKEIIRQAAENVGYIVTCEVCDYPEDLQFLKHSPCMTSKGWAPLLNLGVIFRMFGNCWGELPGQKRGLTSAAKTWNRKLVMGLCEAGDHALTQYLRKRYRVTTETRNVFEGVLGFVTGSYDWGSVDDDDLCRRYGLNGTAVQELIEVLEHAEDGTGSTVETVLTRAVFAKDYGYGEFVDLGEPTQEAL